MLVILAGNQATKLLIVFRNKLAAMLFTVCACSIDLLSLFKFTDKKKYVTQ